MPEEQLIAVLSTLAIFLVNAVLGMLLARYYLKEKGVSYLLWSSGLRFFAIAILLELLFAFGVHSDFLAKVYLFAIAMPLVAFSLGHMQFIRSNSVKKSYYYYCIAAAFAFLLVLYAANLGNAFQGYVAYGSAPLPVTVMSIIIGISASAVLFGIAIKYYMMKKELKILALIPGVALFWLNNVLHVALLSPLLLYYYQLLGIMLIWLGIVGFAGIEEYPQS